MGAALPVLMIGGAALGIGASVMNYQNTVQTTRQNAQMALMGAQMQANQYRLQSAMLMGQSGAYAQQAGMFQQQAAFSSRMGEIARAQENYRAKQSQTEAEQVTQKAAEARRQLVGQGKTMFAANGVMLEARQGAATAMWEQDEAADLAFEMDTIKQNSENETFGYVWNGYSEHLQGLFDAQAQSIQASGAAMNAASSRAEAGISLINADSALLQGRAQAAAAEAQQEQALWGMISNIGGSLLSVGSVFA